MPRMSKKRKQEWALFLNERNRITYNGLFRKYSSEFSTPTIWCVLSSTPTISLPPCVLAKATISTDGTWGNHMQFTSKAIGELGAINGPRCCKRDAMIAFKNGIDYVNAHYGVTLQYEQMQCGFTDFNEQCIKERCLFHE